MNELGKIIIEDSRIIIERSGSLTGFYAMCGLVIFIALAGFILFSWQDKKQQKHGRK